MSCKGDHCGFPIHTKMKTNVRRYPMSIIVQVSRGPVIVHFNK